MTDETASVQDRARALREAFDAAFSGAPVTAAADIENFLGIRIGGDPYAVALAEIAGLFVDRKTVFLPGRAAELLGIAGLRGATVPVYSLRAFLGYPPAEETQRWLMLGGRGQAAFAFDRFDGYVQIEHSGLSAVTDTDTRGHIRARATVAGVRRLIISIPSILDTITGRQGARATRKEH